MNKPYAPSNGNAWAIYKNGKVFLTFLKGRKGMFDAYRAYQKLEADYVKKTGLHHGDFYVGQIDEHDKTI